MSPTGRSVAGVQPLFATGDYSFDGVSGWELESPFGFSGGTGLGTFSFSRSGESLFGSLLSTGTLDPWTGFPVRFSLQYTILGEPGSLALLGLGLVALGLSRRRKLN